MAPHSQLSCFIPSNMHLATEISSSLGDQQAYRSAFPGHVLKITNDIAL
jgi:hypothetical protein